MSLVRLCWQLPLVLDGAAQHGQSSQVSSVHGFGHRSWKYSFESSPKFSKAPQITLKLFFVNFKILFIFGYVGSSLLCAGFL